VYVCDIACLAPDGPVGGISESAVQCSAVQCSALQCGAVQAGELTTGTQSLLAISLGWTGSLRNPQCFELRP